jgi:hypothetical protein
VCLRGPASAAGHHYALQVEPKHAAQNQIPFLNQQGGYSRRAQLCMLCGGGKRASIIAEVKIVTTALIMKTIIKDVPKTHDPELECTILHNCVDVILVRQRAVACYCMQFLLSVMFYIANTDDVYDTY